MELYTCPAPSTQRATCLAGHREDTGLEPSRAELLAVIQGSRETLEGKIELVAIETLQKWDTDHIWEVARSGMCTLI
ncbi:hypothetical protein NDU88_004930 [Pleurodeles waltl]|uniref:Uncharacterized protein n=1 Tax=Pleurodeles waltl TaxID=8319 RepID=A0AAV7TU22_PLEWA|nr:hypothetical protein NDU88_004930 [Pleurodeles waltl]